MLFRSVPHIPKCAGTFLRDMLTGENLDYPILWFDESEESVDDFLDRCILNIDIYDDIVMGGHVTMRLFERVISQSAAKDIVTLIVLRDPFDRFCSHYEYHLRKPFVDLTDEYTGPLDDELYLTGAYKSNLAIINRDKIGRAHV